MNWTINRSTRQASYNKQFKRDSPRLAFLVRVKFSDYGVQIEYCGSVAHPLIGRYIFLSSATKRIHDERG
ncbi:hypothetical protein EAY40_17830 [Vibrio anguillarum]|nr:hypothetical protein [Vibrio anguillarum]